MEAGTAAPGKRDAAPQRLTRASLGGESDPGSASSGRRHHRAMPVQIAASKLPIRGGTGREEEKEGQRNVPAERRIRWRAYQLTWSKWHWESRRNDNTA